MTFAMDTTKHRINQTIAKAGGRVVLPENWAEIDALTEEMESVVYQHISVLDRRAVAQCVAAEMIAQKHAVWREAGHRDINTRFAPHYDDSDPAAMNCLYGLINDNDSLFPLENLDDWKLLAEIGLQGKQCEAHVTRKCLRHNAFTEATPATEVVAVKRGEIICVFKTCLACFVALHTPIAFTDPDYCGPFPWYLDAPQAKENTESPWS